MLPSSTTDLQSQAIADALGGVISSEIDTSVAPGPGMKWQEGEDGILVEVPDDDGAEEPGAKWKSKKGQDDMRKAMEQIVDREYMIKSESFTHSFHWHCC
jgi:hypothetical protein